jgi:hypothetical protein
MSDSSTVAWLSKAIGQATRSAKFCAVGYLPAVDPDIEVDGLGALRLPLKRTTAKELAALCRVAPYGKGTETLVNKNVRNTLELDPKKFRLSHAWNTAIAGVLRPIAQQLGLPADQLEARLYRLLVYEKGGFFLPHRDSEKHNGMVASLIVVLPNPFEGGTLIVRHGVVKQKLTFEQAASGKAPCYAAFYADCEHEVQRVTGGVRLCLAYNLVLKPQRGSPANASPPDEPIVVLAEAIESWVAARPAKPLVFALEHHYTQRGLSLDLLKGADRQLAELIEAAAVEADCLVYLAQVSRHLMQYADDGSFERGYSYRYDSRPRRALEIGETYEDELHGTEWADVDGKKQPWGPIAFEQSSIVASEPIDQWQPTSEEYEGYTGNEGNTLDRWYHRSALVVWHREHHFDVVASSGAADSIPLFCSMTAKLAKTPKKRLDEARGDCLRFARAIIAHWPERIIGYWRARREETASYGDFMEPLLALRDRDAVAQLLGKLATQDQELRLASFIVAACREFGWQTFAWELKQLLTTRPERSVRQEPLMRDAEWLCAFCCDKTADPDRSALAQELCALAVERFCEPLPRRRPSYYAPYPDQRETTVAEASLPLLLKALAASGRDEDLSRVIRFVQEVPEQFSLDDCQVPCLKTLIPWSQKLLGSVPAPLAAWLTALRQQLEGATATPPAPPTDWTRPAEVACSCQYCAQLKAFLADPENAVGRIAAREDVRQHLISMIGHHQCDVKHALERKGSPYALVLTKTTGSYERAVKRYAADRRLLKTLLSIRAQEPD